jgi:hypothetical protein
LDSRQKDWYMSGRAFLFISPIFSLVVALTSPSVSGVLVQANASPIATSMADPFGHQPAATPLGRGGRTVPQGGCALALSLPTSSPGELASTLARILTRSFAAAPEATTSQVAARVAGASAAAETLTGDVTIPASPAPAGAPLDWRAISRPVLDAPVAGHLPFGHIRREAGIAAGLRAGLIWSMQEDV